MWTRRYWSQYQWARQYWPGGSTPATGVVTGPLEGVWTESTRGIVWTEATRSLVWSNRMLSLVKRVAESNTFYAYDFKNDAVVAGGDPLSSALDVTPALQQPDSATDLTLGVPSINGTQMVVSIGGGDDGAVYKLTFRALTVAGATRVGLGKLIVQDEL